MKSKSKKATLLLHIGAVHWYIAHAAAWHGLWCLKLMLAGAWNREITERNQVK